MVSQARAVLVVKMVRKTGRKAEISTALTPGSRVGRCTMQASVLSRSLDVAGRAGRRPVVGVNFLAGTGSRGPPASRTPSPATHRASSLPSFLFGELHQNRAKTLDRSGIHAVNKPVRRPGGAAASSGCSAPCRRPSCPTAVHRAPQPADPVTRFDIELTGTIVDAYDSEARQRAAAGKSTPESWKGRAFSDACELADLVAACADHWDNSALVARPAQSGSRQDHSDGPLSAPRPARGRPPRLR
ncbi:UNVERIFIED_CONTAM: hypothetical protein RKD50_009430 [Streptomyces canus]